VLRDIQNVYMVALYILHHREFNINIRAVYKGGPCVEHNGIYTYMGGKYVIHMAYMCDYSYEGRPYIAPKGVIPHLIFVHTPGEGV